MKDWKYKLKRITVRAYSRGALPTADSQTGFVLIMVLLSLVILVAMTGSLAWTVMTQSMCVDSRVCQSQNDYAMEAAIAVIGQKVQKGELASRVFSEGSAIGSMKIGLSRIFYQVWDEESKYRFAPAVNEMPPFLKATGVRPRSVKKGVTLKSNFALFEDVFDIDVDNLSQFYGPSTEKDTVIDRVTLWSDGRVNINTATDEVIRQQLQDLSKITVERLLQMRRTRHIEDIHQLTSALGRDETEEQILLTRLCTKSSRISVRLICQGESLRTDGFAVLDLEGVTPSTILWHDLPPTGTLPNGQLKLARLPRGVSGLSKALFLRIKIVNKLLSTVENELLPA